MIKEADTNGDGNVNYIGKIECDRVVEVWIFFRSQLATFVHRSPFHAIFHF